MNLILGDLVDACFLFYSDETLIYFTMNKDHTRDVKSIFEWLVKSKLYLECKKCTLFLLEVELFLYVVSKHEVLVSPR